MKLYTCVYLIPTHPFCTCVHAYVDFMCVRALFSADLLQTMTSRPPPLTSSQRSIKGRCALTDPDTCSYGEHFAVSD